MTEKEMLKQIMNGNCQDIECDSCPIHDRSAIRGWGCLPFKVERATYLYNAKYNDTSIKEKTIKKVEKSLMLTMFKGDKTIVKCQFWIKGNTLSFTVLEQDESIVANNYGRDKKIIFEHKGFSICSWHGEEISPFHNNLYVKGDKINSAGYSKKYEFNSKQELKDYLRKVKKTFIAYNKQNNKEDVKEKSIEDKVVEWWEDISKSKLMHKEKESTFNEFLVNAYPHEKDYIVEKTIEKVIELFNDGWKPNFTSGLQVWAIYYNRESKEFTMTDYSYSANIKHTNYFKSEELGERAIAILQDFYGINLLAYYMLGKPV